MRLEPWQRFKKASPCPNCGGYNGAYDKSNRCKGFLRREGDGFYCREENGTKPLDFPVPLYLYAFSDENEDQKNPSSSYLFEDETPREVSFGGPLTSHSSPIPSDAIPQTLCEGYYNRRRIEEETQVYPKQSRWRPAEKKKWYVVYDGDKEITRSLNKKEAERYLHV